MTKENFSKEDIMASAGFIKENFTCEELKEMVKGIGGIEGQVLKKAIEMKRGCEVKK